jgi:hypothetical protein
MNVVMPTWSIGAIIALVVLVICIILLIVGGHGSPSHLTLGLIAALAVARLT